MNTETIHDRLSEVETFLSSEFMDKHIEPASYVDTIHALADASLALARAGTPAAERPMHEASEAESRFQRREQRNARAGACLRAAVAASLCMADGGEDQAGEWLLQLSKTLPPSRVRALAFHLPARVATAASSSTTHRMHHLRSHRRTA